MATSYSLNAWIAGYTALLGEITGGAGDATVSIFDADDELLAEATIDAEASEVSATTGDITIEIDTQEDSAPAGGTASYAQIINGDGEPTIQVPCATGSTPSPGFCVLNTLTVIESAPVEILTVTIPAGTILS
jgi:hypothetical protein